jgi:hypothetical protein
LLAMEVDTQWFYITWDIEAHLNMTSSY